MARKVVDLSGKLGLSEPPQIRISDKVTLTVNDSAKSMMQVLAITNDGMRPEHMGQIGGLLFDEDSAASLDEANLTLNDLISVYEAAVNLIMGDEGGDEGNTTTPATT